MDIALGVRIPTIFYKGFIGLTSFLLWIEGIFFLVAGASLYHTLSIFFLDDFGFRSSGTFAYIMMAFGAASFLASCVTPVVISYPNMRRFALLAFYYGVLLFFEATMSVFSFTYVPKMRDIVKHGIATIMLNYNAMDAINSALNGLQQKMGCCGTDDYSSWFQTSWANGLERVPASCCMDTENCHNLEPMALSDIYTKGCYPRLDAGRVAVNTFFVGALVANVLFLVIGIYAAVKLGRRYQKIRQIDSVVPFAS